ncbi:MAG TPA: DNA polymerase III subunit gamma/tau [Pyrinomonadaceae bacterium]|nr:DNA polymerase III subunit gamma/tau [Pyrinomonadaceae bacterium]
MSYQVIARKWRPQTFEEVTGQEPITRTLRNAIEHERLHHAYLFSGARGVGKTTSARLLAKALNCHKAKKPTATPCASDDPAPCASCREIAEGRSIDVMEIDAASNTGVDNVRDAIIGNVAISPARDRYKVFIIDEVHMLSGAAFNALLKTLEEPPPRVVFIMATTELHKVPDTILSRCQQFEFRTIPTQKIMERLRLIAEAEKIKVTDDALKEIARAGEGSMRDAQSAFDQVISFSGTKIKAEDVETALGIAGTEMLSRVVRAVGENRPQDALAVVDDLVMRGHDLRNFCRDLLAYMRDLLVAKVSGEESEALESSAQDRAELRGQAALFSESDLVRFFHQLTQTETLLRTAAHPRYQLEIGLVKLVEMRRLAPLNQILERLSALEEALRTGRSPVAAGGTQQTGGGGGSSSGGGHGPSRGAASGGGSASRRASSEGYAAQPPAAEVFNEQPLVLEGTPTRVDEARTAAPVLTLVPPASPQVEKPPAPAPPPAASHAQHGSVLENIKDALEKRRRMFVVTALDGARRAGVDGDELFVEFAPEAKHLRDTLAKAENVKLLREVCQELTGREMGVRISVREEGESEDGDAPPTRDDEERRERERLRRMAEQHPVVQSFLETFRGEIVDVKQIKNEA